MNYLDMVKSAQNGGKFNEKQMWQSIGSVSDLLEEIKDSHNDLYFRFMREQAGIMNGGHYDKIWADYDVSQISYTDGNGKSHTGAYWTCDQIEDATKGMTFPSGTTKWDKFVAFNSFFSDTCKSLTDDQIIKSAYQFYFSDEDFGKDRGSKIWCYMKMVHSK